MQLKRLGLIAIILTASLMSMRCTQTYYSVWETLGKDKRDLLHDNVEDVREEQEGAKKQFEDALSQMRDLYGTGGGDLEKMYDALQEDYNASKKRAEQLRNRIERVETVGNDLFYEWEREAGEISDSKLKRNSRSKLQETKNRFQNMTLAMRRAEKSMQPVLTKFNDHVLYLKHNLNAQTVGNLSGEVASIEISMQDLMRDMNRSIAAADAFIKTLPTADSPPSA